MNSPRLVADAKGVDVDLAYNLEVFAVVAVYLVTLVR